MTNYSINIIRLAINGNTAAVRRFARAFDRRECPYISAGAAEGFRNFCCACHLSQEFPEFTLECVAKWGTRAIKAITTFEGSY